MARPLRIEFPGAFYHVISRGNERKAVFRKPADYELFLKTLKDACDYFNARIHSYCLIPNHLHLLIETKDANLSGFMKRLLGVYTIRFNRRHKRHGHLFQGRYKAFLVDKDNYLLELSRYIHLNPVKAKLVRNPQDYPWSSMRYFVRDKSPEYLYTRLILDEFRSTGDYQNFVGKRHDTQETPLDKAIGGMFLGSNEFADKFKERLLTDDLKKISKGRQLAMRPIDRMEGYLKDQDRNLKIYCYWKIGRMTQPEIGKRFGVSGSAISYMIKRFELKMQKDSKLRRQVQTLETAISIFKN